MKKVSLKKEILVIVLAIIALIAINTQVFATGTSAPINPININIINTDVPNSNPTPINPQPGNTTPVTPVNNLVSNYQNTTLPQTGDASDYAILFVVVVAAIIAVYAFRRSKDYKF